MKIIIANDPKLETHNLAIKFIRIFSVPLLNSLPISVIKKMMTVSSHDGRVVVGHGGSNYALEAMYTRYERTLFSRGILQGFADSFWHHCVSQPKAIRNRLKIVEEYMENEISRIAKRVSSIGDRKIITILTIGGGSARAIIESIHKFSDKNLIYKIINIDKSQKAIEVSKEIAKKFDLYENFKWINDDARNIKFLVPDNSIDIVEMVGLLDYFFEERGIEVIKQIYNVLKNDGVFVTANVYPNSEIPFVYKTGWPKMYYRTPDDLSRILKMSGFSIDKGKIIFEPLKIHIITIIRK